MATYYGDWISVSHGVEKFRMKIVTSYSQNIANNSSTITIKQYIQGGSHVSWGDEDQNIGGYTESIKLVGDGASQTKSGFWQWSDNGDKLIQSKTWTKKHNSDGKASFSFSGTCSMWFNQVWIDSSGRHQSGTTKTVSIGQKTISLPQIAQGSKISAGSSQITFGNNISFSINRSDSSFKHTLIAELYNHKETIATDVGTSKTWTVPTNWIQYTPNNANPKITVTCKTYKGSSKIGSDSICTFSCKVPETDAYKPTCSLSLNEANATVSALNLGKYIQGVSQIHAQITAAGVAGSTISSYSTPANDVVYSTNNFTTDVLKYNGGKTIETTVVDSRGRNATAHQDIEIIQYFNPTIMSCKVERCSSSGTLDEEGIYGKATISYKVAPLNDGTSNRNTITIKVYYGSTIYKTYTPSNFEGTYTFPNNNLFSNLPTNANSGFTFVIEDRFHKESSDSAITQSYILPPSFVTISKLAGGKGVTFGRSAYSYAYTQDTVYQTGKKYFSYNSQTGYSLLNAGTDYTIGAVITANTVYENGEGLVNYMDTKLKANTWAKNISVSGLKTEKFAEGSWITYVE